MPLFSESEYITFFFCVLLMIKNYFQLYDNKETTGVKELRILYSHDLKDVCPYKEAAQQGRTCWMEKKKRIHAMENKRKRTNTYVLQHLHSRPPLI